MCYDDNEEKVSGLRLLGRAVIARAARDILDSLDIGGKPISRATRRDAMCFFQSASMGGPEEVWFALAGIRPTKLLEDVLYHETLVVLGK